jgi:hypothetical protein
MKEGRTTFGKLEGLAPLNKVHERVKRGYPERIVVKNMKLHSSHDSC